MPEITLTEEQYVKAIGILWEAGQFRRGKLVCDEDDVHEYLSEARLINDYEESDFDHYDWLSDESRDRIMDTTLDYSIFGFSIAQ